MAEREARVMASYEDARGSFHALLRWHLDNGTRPSGAGHPRRLRWTNGAFARAIREAFKTTCDESAVRHWKTGRHLPDAETKLDYIERVLFGNEPTGQYADYRDDLRKAYASAKDGSAPLPQHRSPEMERVAEAARTHGMPSISVDGATKNVILERLWTLLNDGDQVERRPEAQRPWKAEALRLIDTLLGSSPINVHSEGFYEFRNAGTLDEQRAILRAIIQSTGERGDLRSLLEELLAKAGKIAEQPDVQRPWRAQVARLIDTFLGPSPINVHSEGFYEFRNAATFDEQQAILRAILLSAPRPKRANVPLGPVDAKLTPRNRDELRRARNKLVEERIAALPYIVGTRLFQINDHTDEGYSIHVSFDGSRTSATEVLKTIRDTFDTVLPNVPYWGEMLSESDNSVAFGFTYLDNNRKYRNG
jgi:hypothetical protein